MSNTKPRKQFDHAELHKELFSIVSMYNTGLITDMELLQCCDKIKELYATLDLTNLCDPNTGLRFPADYKPFDYKPFN
jgi:hypothetical protein